VTYFVLWLAAVCLGLAVKARVSTPRSRKKPLLATPLALVIGLVASLVQAAPAQASDPGDQLYCKQITGLVSDPYGRPVSGIEVVLNATPCHEGMYPDWDSTDASGVYTAYAYMTLPTDTVPAYTHDPMGTFARADKPVSPMPVAPANNNFTVYYATTIQAPSQAFSAGGTASLNALSAVPTPSANPAGNLFAELPGGSMVALMPPVGDPHSSPWTGSFATSTTAGEGTYAFYVCAPQSGYTGRCSTAAQANLLSALPVARGTYTIDNTPPKVDASSFSPANSSSTAYASQPLMVKVSDNGSGLDLSHSSFTLDDTTAGTSRPIAGSALSYSNGWLRTTAQPLADGHVYHLSVTAADNAGNTATQAQAPTVAGGGFLATHQTPQGTQASVPLTSSCSLSANSSPAYKTATCTNIPVHLDATTLTLGGSRQGGPASGFVDQGISQSQFGNLMMVSNINPVPTKVYDGTVNSSTPPPVPTQPQRFDVPAPFAGDRSLTVPASDNILLATLSFNVVAAPGLQSVSIYLDPVATAVSTETCSDPSTSSRSIYCSPDPARSHYIYAVKDASNVPATAAAVVTGTGCAVDNALDSAFTATCPLNDAINLSANPQIAIGTTLLPQTPTLPGTFDTSLEQLIQDQAVALGSRFGGATWETDGTVTVRFTAGAVPASLQNNPKILTLVVPFSLDQLDSAMDTVASRLNPLLAPGITPGTPGAWPWTATVDNYQDAVVVAVDPSQLSKDAAVQNSLADLVAAGTVRLTHQPVSPTDLTCSNPGNCAFPFRGGTWMQGQSSPYFGCTMAFAMTDGLNIRYMGSASHCAGSPWKQGAYNIGHTVWTQDAGKVDFKVIGENNESQPAPKNFVYRPDNTATPITLKIVSPSSTIGNTVCLEGAISGQECGTMESANATMNGRPGFGQFASPQVCHGDSGAPVINYYNNRAYGEIRGMTVDSRNLKCYANTDAFFTWLPYYEAASGYKTLLSDTTDTLGPGQRLLPGDHLVSNDGAYQLVMQSDGNLVGYASNGAFWASGTANHPGASAVMQNDGNFVIYGTNNTPLWSQACCAGGSRIVMQTDRNIVIYHPDNGVGWASNT
jgi:hypothetical protein